LSQTPLAAKQHRRRHPKQTFPVSTINLLENSAQSWYDAGYINVRRHYRTASAS